jgi:hypothetical protein
VIAIVASCSFATPRAMIRISWSLVISTFSGFKSRWTIPAAWTAQSPPSASQSSVRTTFSCRTVFPTSASRRNRLKNPGVSSRCGWTTLSATTPSGPVAR